MRHEWVDPGSGVTCSVSALGAHPAWGIVEIEPEEGKLLPFAAEVLRLAERVRALEAAALPFIGGVAGWLPDGTPHGMEVHTVGVSKAEHEALVAVLAQEATP